MAARRDSAGDPGDGQFRRRRAQEDRADAVSPIAPFANPACVAAAAQRRFESETPSRPRVGVHLLEHEPPGAKSRRLRAERVQTRRDEIGVDEPRAGRLVGYPKDFKKTLKM